MHFAGLRLPDALAAAKKCRPVINPIGMLIQVGSPPLAGTVLLLQGGGSAVEFEVGNLHVHH